MGVTRLFDTSSTYLAAGGHSLFLKVSGSLAPFRTALTPFQSQANFLSTLPLYWGLSLGVNSNSMFNTVLFFTASWSSRFSPALSSLMNLQGVPFLCSCSKSSNKGSTCSSLDLGKKLHDLLVLSSTANTQKVLPP